MKREKNSGGGRGGPPYLYYVLFSSLGPTSTAPKLVAAGTLHGVAAKQIVWVHSAI